LCYSPEGEIFAAALREASPYAPPILLKLGVQHIKNIFSFMATKTYDLLIDCESYLYLESPFPWIRISVERPLV
jgi:hypothetical protein